MRTRIAQQSGLSLPQRLFLKKVLTNRSLFHGLLRAAAVGQKPFVKEGTVRHLPFFLAGQASVRNLPALAEEPLRNWFNRYAAREAEEKAGKGAARKQINGIVSKRIIKKPEKKVNHKVK